MWSLCGTLDCNVAEARFIQDSSVHPSDDDKGNTYYDMFTPASRYLQIPNACGMSEARQFTILMRGYVDAVSYLLAGASTPAVDDYTMLSAGSDVGWTYGHVGSGAYAQYNYGDEFYFGYNNWGMVYNGQAAGNANRLKLYMDGVKVAATYVGTVPAAAPVLTHFDVNGYYGSTGFIYGFSYYTQVLVYNRALSDEEVRMWHRNRFGMYAQNNTLRLGIMPPTGVAAAMFRNRQASRGGMMQHAGGVQ